LAVFQPTATVLKLLIGRADCECAKSFCSVVHESFDYLQFLGVTLVNANPCTSLLVHYWKWGIHKISKAEEAGNLKPRGL
ncbi:unnamed protein product, partial [Allacma fusca]